MTAKKNIKYQSKNHLGGSLLESISPHLNRTLCKIIYFTLHGGAFPKFWAKNWLWTKKINLRATNSKTMNTKRLTSWWTPLKEKCKKSYVALLHSRHQRVLPTNVPSCTTTAAAPVELIVSTLLAATGNELSSFSVCNLIVRKNEHSNFQFSYCSGHPEPLFYWHIMLIEWTTAAKERTFMKLYEYWLDVC